MARYGLAGALIATVVIVAACGGDDKEPALTDDLLAQEMSQTLYGKPIEDAAAGPEGAKDAMVDSALHACRMLRATEDAGIISTEIDYPGNTFGIQSLIDRVRSDAGWTTHQAFDSYRISAKYKCDEFSPILRVYDATSQ